MIARNSAPWMPLLLPTVPNTALNIREERAARWGSFAHVDHAFARGPSGIPSAAGRLLRVALAASRDLHHRRTTAVGLHLAIEDAPRTWSPPWYKLDVGSAQRWRGFRVARDLLAGLVVLAAACGGRADLTTPEADLGRGG